MKYFISSIFSLLLLAPFALSAQNTAIQLDGNSEFLSIAHKESQNITDEFTFEAWIFANSWTNEIWRGTIIGKDNQGPDRGYAFRCGADGSLSLVIAVDNAWHETFTSSLMNTQQWHHVAATVKDKTVQLYIDGQPVASSTFDGDPSPNTSDLKISASGFDGRFFDGIIDEVRLWEVARTQTQIADNAAVDLTGAEDGLTLYLPMNEGAGTIATNLVDENCSATGIGIDDGNWVEGYKLPDFDLALKSIDGFDRVNMKTRPVKISAGVQNVGTMEVSDFDLTVSVDGEVLFTESISQTIAPGELVTINLDTPIDLTLNEAPEIEVELSFADDGNAFNNISNISLDNRPGNRIVLFNSEQHNFGSSGQNQFTSVVLPGDLSKYSQLMMHISVECPSSGCDPWDQPAKVIATTEEGTFEIARYITPYGIACGPWTIDITDFKSLLTGSIDFQSFIQVWGPSGWLTTIELELIEGNDPFPYYKTTPLWQTDYQVYGDPGIDHDLSPYNIDVASNTEASHVRMQITGHGQGNTFNAAEFYDVTHSLEAGAETYPHRLWKDDCASNGCDDQAGNWLFPRAGWCPGQEVQPAVFITTNALTPGSTGVIDYALADYTNLLNTGYNSSGHTEPHYRIHGYLVEQSSERFMDYSNIEATSILLSPSTDFDLSMVTLEVTNNGSVTAQGVVGKIYLNGELLATQDLAGDLQPGASAFMEFNVNTEIMDGLNPIVGEVDFALDETPGDNLIVEYLITVAVPELDLSSNFSIKPNPSSGNFQVELDESLIGSTLKVLNAQGQILETINLQSLQQNLVLDQAGMYFIRIDNKEGAAGVQRIVIVK